jgi:Arc/MetJ-type ribon-helix-helix transcriptional regulator
MSTTTVRLDDEDEALLDMLAPEFGGRSSAIRQALRNLAADRRREDALRSFVDDWDAEAGPVDEEDIAAMADRYGL